MSAGIPDERSLQRTSPCSLDIKSRSTIACHLNWFSIDYPPFIGQNEPLFFLSFVEKQRKTLQNFGIRLCYSEDSLKLLFCVTIGPIESAIPPTTCGPHLVT
jgi:hypothetical protein